MKKKTVVKIVLDAIMLIVIVTMYSKNCISMAYHEVGGLALIGAFAIHKLLNGDWIVRVTRKLRDHVLPGRTRLVYAVDALLLVAFLAIGISGVFISHVLFGGAEGDAPAVTEMAEQADAASALDAEMAVLEAGGAPSGDRAGNGWKTVHYCASALSLILVGIHLGLHAQYLSGLLFKKKRPANAARRAVAVALIVLICGYGAYAMATTSFGRWLAMPFSSGGEQTRMKTPNADGGEEAGVADAQGEGLSGNAGGRSMRKRGEAQPFSLSACLLVVAQFFGILFVFATATALVDAAFRKKRRPAMA